MNRSLIVYYAVFVIILLLSCSGTPTSEVSCKGDWKQKQTGDQGEKLNYEVEVENLSYFTITGYVEIEVKCSEGSKYSKKVKFSEVPALSTSKEKGSMDVDNKKVDDVEIKEENFTIK